MLEVEAHRDSMAQMWPSNPTPRPPMASECFSSCSSNPGTFPTGSPSHLEYANTNPTLCHHHGAHQHNEQASIAWQNEAKEAPVAEPGTYLAAAPAAYHGQVQEGYDAPFAQSFLDTQLAWHRAKDQRRRGARLA